MKASIQILTILATVALGACSQEITDDAASEESSQELSQSGSEYALSCKRSDGVAASVVVAARRGSFDVTAKAEGSVLFAATAQRPSLNVRIEDGTSSAVTEYVDFNNKGLETVAVDGPNAIEVDLSGPKAFLYKDASKTVQLTSCRFDKDKLVRFLAIDFVAASRVDMTNVKAVGFDIDDTLAYTTPTFARGFVTGGTPAPTDTLFWTHTNGCDSGCEAETITLLDGTTKLLPSNAASTAKSKALELIKRHKAHGHKVYAITARPDINGAALRDYLEQELGLDPQNVFFEPDMDLPGNPKGKTDRIESLNLDVFYGDSDSDITDTQKAFVDSAGVHTKEVRAIRFMRSPKSSNRKAGKLNKYHPGYYGETVVKDSYQ
jgi:acid phosphatase class B